MMKRSTLLLAVLTALVLTGCAGGKLAESGETDSLTYSFAGIEKDLTTKRGKAMFVITNTSNMNVARISGDYQVLDEDGKILASDKFSKDEYPYLLQPGQKRKMSVVSGTLPSKAASMRIKITNVRYK